MKKYLERIYNGIARENPIFILMLGMCPTLAVTTSATNGLGMGISTMAVLIFSNLVISLLRKVIPNQVRLPAYIVIVASLVTVTQLLIQAYVPAPNSSRTRPISVSASVKPRPMPMPSKAEITGGFLAA